MATHAAATLDANTNVLLASQYYTKADLCTEMCLLETAAQAIVATASGRELPSRATSAKEVLRDRVTTLGARFLSEVFPAVCGMDLKNVNLILRNLLLRFEKNFADAPAGKTFWECYDLDKTMPSGEYLDIYDSAVKTFPNTGSISDPARQNEVHY